MRIVKYGVLAGALAALALPTSAMAIDNWSVGAGVGTTGYGGSVSYRFHDNLAVTAGYSGFTYDGMDYESDDADYEGDFDIDVYGLTLDYFPFGGRFFLSAGAVRPDIAMQVVGSPKDGQSFEFNGHTYTSSEVGSVKGEVTLADSIQPYLGLGWRGSHKSGLGVFSQVGVFFTDAEVNLSTTGALANSNARLQRDLQKEEDDLQDDVDQLSVYPVAVVGIEYTF